MNHFNWSFFINYIGIFLKDFYRFAHLNWNEGISGPNDNEIWITWLTFVKWLILFFYLCTVNYYRLSKTIEEKCLFFWNYHQIFYDLVYVWLHRFMWIIFNLLFIHCHKVSVQIFLHFYYVWEVPKCHISIFYHHH